MGHALYIADFDAKARTITNPNVIANAEADPARPFLHACWTRDESAFLYHANLKRDSSLANNDTGIWVEGNQLYMYRLEDGSTVRAVGCLRDSTPRRRASNGLLARRRHRTQ